MTQDKFNEVIKGEIGYCQELLICKGHEYNDGRTDRLDTFKRSSALQHNTPIQALAGMMCKHTASIYDMANQNSDDVEKWQEKITDHINYLLLLWAVVLDEHT